MRVAISEADRLLGEYKAAREGWLAAGKRMREAKARLDTAKAEQRKQKDRAEVYAARAKREARYQRALGALKMHNNGATFTQIGEALGVCPQRARDIVEIGRRKVKI